MADCSLWGDVSPPYGHVYLPSSLGDEAAAADEATPACNSFKDDFKVFGKVDNYEQFAVQLDLLLNYSGKNPLRIGILCFTELRISMPGPSLLSSGFSVFRSVLSLVNFARARL